MEDKRIIFTTAEGTTSIIVPAPGCTVEQAIKAVPVDLAYEIVDVVTIPSDRTFRNAWFHDTTPELQKIGVHMDKAKDIAHERRRAKRSAEFAPLDIQATIPSKAESAEVARQAIRDKHDSIQASIDSCVTADELWDVVYTEGI
jgi:hypothetical protein